ncbi:glycosyltransferase [Poseidonibacter lekithochrous]|uniref:glycosyltransferase n=1 Tax=Poseidonibacter lekithochrous TaxID=1904463 RepID=UPI0008FC4963|nr:glycosyltransferase [Poseidonibacter lekithochrous]QKJ22281.1 glycosyltransferase, family 1 [Poseidonibacter lekithochrous]
MKILQVIPNLNTGGAEKFCIDLSNELSKDNEVILCSLFDINESMFLANKINDNVKVVTLGKKLGADWKIFFKIYSLIKKEKPDIIHTHLKALFYSILSIFLFKNLKFFHTIHNIATKENSKIFMNIYNILFNKFGVKPVAISEKVLKTVHDVYGTNHKIKIDNGVLRPMTTDLLDNVKKEIEDLKINQDTKVFLNIARISPQKNQMMLVEVFNKLIEEGNNIILLIIGEDSTVEKEYYNSVKLISKQGITFLGLRNNIADYLYYSDVFCLSSDYEGLPITLLESMSMGCLPICTPVGGIPDVIKTEVNGLLAIDKNKKEFYNIVSLYLRLEESEKRIIKKNTQSKFEEGYDIEMCSSKYYNEYSK